MPGYHIEWTIELEASTPEEAARAAMKIQRDPNSWGQVFDVTDECGETVRVDLNEMIQDGEPDTVPDADDFNEEGGI